MLATDQQSLTDDQLKAIYRALSPERVATYYIAAGRDDARAMRLYLWNARIGEAFHLPIQAVEVALRNSVNCALTAEFGDEWWRNPAYLKLIDHDREVDLATVQRRIRNRKLEENTGQIVAGLSFGFWVGMLQPRYNPALWSKQIKSAFPYLPEGRSRKALALKAGEIAFLRNRISHHEPLFKRSVMDDYKLVMEMLEWLCPHKTEWLKPHCRVPEIARIKP